MEIGRPMRAARRDLARGGAATAVAVVGMIVANRIAPEVSTYRARVALIIAGAALVFVAGVVAVRAVAAAVRKAAEQHSGDARGATLGFVMTIIGYLLVLLAVLGALNYLRYLRGLLLGGAITGIVIGIAAQQTLGNFFAGVVLLIARPFEIGEEVVMRSGPLGGEYRGRVVDMGLYYVKLETEQGPVDLPNAGVLSSAIGPGAAAVTDAQDEEEAEEGAPQ